ncbi:MAG: pectin acetylesterase-family hydrolase [Pseudomonadota bacterium]
MKSIRLVVCLVAGLMAADAALADWRWFSPGLDRQAKRELRQAGVTKYLGHFTPTSSEDVGGGWVRHRYDQNQGGPFGGPICITGSEYSVFSRIRNPRKLLIFAQGGGACWQGFYNCTPIVDVPNNMPPPPPVGLWSDEGLDIGFGAIPNPFADYSVVFLPYCDGSVFTGDNDVLDPEYPLGPVRFHRGLRNLSAGMDLAKQLVPRPRQIVVAGSSAGGVGASSFAPLLARFKFGNYRDLAVFNDAGPNAINLLDVPGLLARAADWRNGQFFPRSCTRCDELGQGVEIVRWRMSRDRTVREAFYSTDGDATNRFFLFVPTQEQYRELLLTVHGALNREFPFRYKRFIESGSDTHTALQTPLLYLAAVNDLPLNLWVTDFTRPLLQRWITALREGRLPVWIDSVEPFEPLPPPAP